MGTHAREIMPAGHAEVIVPHASTNFSREAQGIWVGGVGDVAVVLPSDDVVIFLAVPSGTLLPVRAKRVNAVGTDATSMVAMMTRSRS